MYWLFLFFRLAEYQSFFLAKCQEMFFKIPAIMFAWSRLIENWVLYVLTCCCCSSSSSSLSSSAYSSSSSSLFLFFLNFHGLSHLFSCTDTDYILKLIAGHTELQLFTKHQSKCVFGRQMRCHWDAIGFQLSLFGVEMTVPCGKEMLLDIYK